MHILHINSYYGNRMFYKKLYNRQILSGKKLDVYVPVPKGSSLSKEDLGPYTLVSKNHGKYDRFIYHLKHNKIVKDIDTRYNFNNVDILHAHSLFSNGYVAYKLHKQYNVDYIVAVRMPDIYTFFKYMVHLRKTGINILKHASKIVFLSEGFRETLINKYVPEELRQSILEKSVIISNGVAPYWLENKGEQKEITENTIKLLQVGLITKIKNPEITLEAVDELAKRGIDATITFVGEAINKNLLNNLEKNSNAKHIPRVEKEELMHLYREHDIFILPSIKETFGLVYVEAMSQGLPILYSKGQGFDKQYEEGLVGFSVENQDAKDIADKIEKTIKKYKYISNNGIVRSDDFDWDLIERKYDEIYLKTLK